MLEEDLGLSFARSQYTREHKRAQKRFKISSLSVEIDFADGDVDEDVVGFAPDSVLSPTEAAHSDEEFSSSLVTFDIFCRDYWPHLPQSLTKNLGKRIFLLSHRCEAYVFCSQIPRSFLANLWVLGHITSL